MTGTKSLEDVARHVDGLLNLERQVWLLGAGVSLNAGIPLMWALTKRVQEILADPQPVLTGEDTRKSVSLLNTICDQLPTDCHIEHYLSQIGDLISLAERKKEKKVEYGGDTFTADDLRAAHRHVQLAIRFTVEYGYVPANGKAKAKIGNATTPIVNGDFHRSFVTSLFHERRAGLERRPPIRFFTTNYDTLLEDALASACVPFVDGFAGGASAFWDPGNTTARLEVISSHGLHSAIIYKLHGSIDWIATSADVVMRVRTSAVQALTDPRTRLLIYPQATKYQVTQRDPFATLFSDFRNALTTQSPTVLIVCGYSFGDDHINEEIERALKNPKSTLTVLAFCEQRSQSGKLLDNEGLPPTVAAWLSAHCSWSERVVVAGSHGFYQGSLSSSLSMTPAKELSWWTFEGLTQFVKNGPESLQ